MYTVGDYPPGSRLGKEGRERVQKGSYVDYERLDAGLARTRILEWVQMMQGARSKGMH